LPVSNSGFPPFSTAVGETLDGADGTLAACEEATVPPGMPRDLWNAGDVDASVLVELSPPDPRFEAMIATLFGPANADKTNANGLPNPLQLALVGEEFADVIRSQGLQLSCRGRCSAFSEHLGDYGVSRRPPGVPRPRGCVSPDPDIAALAGLPPWAV
jgi:hypothetical protein